MQQSKIFSVVSMAATCALLIGGLYAGCSNDVEENYDEQITTLADETMTRAGENETTGFYSLSGSSISLATGTYNTDESLWIVSKPSYTITFNYPVYTKTDMGIDISYEKIDYTGKMEAGVGYSIDKHGDITYSGGFYFTPGYTYVSVSITSVSEQSLSYTATLTNPYYDTGEPNGTWEKVQTSGTIFENQ